MDLLLVVTLVEQKEGSRKKVESLPTQVLFLSNFKKEFKILKEWNWKEFKRFSFLDSLQPNKKSYANDNTAAFTPLIYMYKENHYLLHCSCNSQTPQFVHYSIIHAYTCADTCYIWHTNNNSIRAYRCVGQICFNKQTIRI